MLYRNFSSTLVAALALAIGIGVNTAVFTADKAMVARPLDARDAGHMVNLALVQESGAPEANFKLSRLPDISRLHAFLSRPHRV